VRRLPRNVRAVTVACLLVATTVFLPSTTPHARAAALPAGFQETIVFSGLVSPTNVQFAADGRVFVAEKRGTIKVFDSLTDTTPTTFADLRINVHDFWDRGLLGLELDPAFPTNPYVYVLYTYDHILGEGAPAPRWGDTCPSPPGATGDGCVVSGRLSRLQAAGNVMTGAEQVLIEDWCQQYPSHSIGSLAFGADGALYVSGGDGASFNFADYGQAGGSAGSPIAKNPCGDPPAGPGGTMTAPTAEGGALRSQDVRSTADPTSLDGTILRVDPATGLGLSGNPFASSADTNARRIVAFGLRNPFRITTRPGTSEVWLGDVGWSTWEELNRVPSPADSVADNFGWPCYEGAGRQASYDNLNLTLCESLYTSGAVVAPFYTYRHTDSIVSGEACANGQGSSTVGMAFYEGGDYPAAYDGALFFADYSRDCLWVMTKGTNGLPDPTKRSNFLTPAANPVDLKIGPGGDLFYVDINGGTIRRIEYFSANQPPAAAATASPTSGAAPLQVSFDGSGSTDPDGDPLTYAWDLNGDGTFGDATTVAPTFTYQASGTYQAVLRVTDPEGASDLSPAIAISVGNTPPSPVIDSPAATLTWAVGDVISFGGHATDAQDGNVPATALTWDLILQHCTSQGCHEHPQQSWTGASGSFSAPDHPYPSYLELRLTARDTQGLTTTVSRALNPKIVDLTFATNPTGLQLAFGGDSAAAPFTRTVIQGSLNSVSAQTPQDHNGIRYEFQSWSDGGPSAKDVRAGSAPTTYTANFVPVSADLGVTQVGSSANGRVTFTITTRNGGPTTARATALTDRLASKLTFVSASSGCSYTAATRLLTCNLGDLAVGAEVTTTVVAGYKGKGNVDHAVSVSSSTPDPATANNSSVITTKLR
jgi:uncharacterized repeat protein (TIGR01451 family)